MGPRLSPGVPADRLVAPAFPQRPGDGADGHGHRTGARGHRQAVASARAGLLRRELQPAQSHLPRLGQVRFVRADSQLHSRPSARERHHLLPGAQDDGRPREQAHRRRHQIRALSRRPHADRTLDESGGVSARRNPRGVCDDCVRHGHQQTQRALRHPLRPAEEHRGLLPGNRPCGPRRSAERMSAAVQSRRPHQADAVH